jgi:hypothetical protein
MKVEVGLEKFLALPYSGAGGVIHLLHHTMALGKQGHFLLILLYDLVNLLGSFTYG